ncbi:MAG: hypothetical protein QOJ16_2339 [Acidobacteriota bacterium]|jgi:hypothetical protein|nr:hypothetical protein [Acidobacteriota bacterium]
MKIVTLGWLLLLHLGLGLSAQAQPLIPRALLRVHASYAQSRHGLRLIDEDIFVSTDRSVEEIESFASNTSSLPPPWFRQSKTATGSAQDFATLVAVLADNQVGQQTGNCSVPVTVSPDSGWFEITWYSRGLRKNVIVAQINGSTPPCPPEIARILHGIEVYAAAAGAFTQ